jgi:hypothetical protein
MNVGGHVIWSKELPASRGAAMRWTISIEGTDEFDATPVNLTLPMVPEFSLATRLAKSTSKVYL